MAKKSIVLSAKHWGALTMFSIMPVICCLLIPDQAKADLPTIVETGSFNDSSDAEWWLNSGAYIYRSGDIASSVQGELATDDRFRVLYSLTNPVDSDNGYHPQNLLRWVTRANYKNFSQQVYFKINRINLSDSPNRNASNGVFFFNRYQDGNNLYYAGIRVDGTAVIKKKYQGQYTTLKSARVYPGQYNRATQVNFLPVGQWVGLKAVVVNDSNQNVDITLYMNLCPESEDWVPLLNVIDSSADILKISGEGHAGIRTDFMDVDFKGYRSVENLP